MPGPNVQHKRGTRSALNALAAANGLLDGQIYVIVDEGRIACATSPSTYESYAKLSETNGSWIPFSITISNFKGVYEYQSNVTAIGVSIGDIVQIALAPTNDNDENEPEGLLIRSMSAVSLTDAFTLRLAFDELTSGPIKLLYKV